MALKDIPNEVSVVMDRGDTGFTVKFVGSPKDILFLWAILTREVSKKLEAPLSVMAHMVMVTRNFDKFLDNSKDIRIDMKIPKEGG